MAEYASVDLSPIIRSIEVVGHTLNSNLAVVDSKVENLNQQAEATKDRLEQLCAEFSLFVDSDRKAKELQKALTEIIRVRQELEKKFGYYDEVRRTTLGILQATDAGLVRQNTIQNVTEELMLAAPSYWLAPALVALSSWVKDDRPLAEKAMHTAITRDDNKTSLFFALICRRARRSDGATQWLMRYFQMQNPLSMDREVVVMLDAVANGVFGGGALAACSTVMEQWLTELEQQAGFLAEQRTRWAAKLDVMAPRVSELEFPTLHKQSSTAPSLMKSLSGARRHQVVFDFFGRLFEGEIVVPPSLQNAVDDILASLVKNFDDEELPLRKEERLYQLIKEENGDIDPARNRLAAESEVFDERTNFAALLTNSAMSPEQFGATKATQRYAVSRSRNWILAAHQDLVARDRSQVPQDVELSCGAWTGTSVDGSNEQQIVTDIKKRYDKKLETALAAVVMEMGTKIGVVAGVAVGLWMLVQGVTFIGLVIAVAAGAYGFSKYSGLEKIREETTRAHKSECDTATKMARACLAELADLRRSLASEDAKATMVSDFLESLRSTQFVLKRPEQSRAAAS